MVDALDDDLAARLVKMIAPIPRSIVINSMISGSLAALRITLRPLASAPRYRQVSVAPTLGYPSLISVPRSGPERCAT